VARDVRDMSDMACFWQQQQQQQQRLMRRSNLVASGSLTAGGLTSFLMYSVCATPFLKTNFQH
jgi:hypothetical protein